MKLNLIALLAVCLGCVLPIHAMSSNYPSLDDSNIEGLRFEQGNFDDDEEVEIVMENRWLRLVFEPEHGGTISSVYYKPEKLELTKRSVNGDWGGLFRNVIDNNPSKMDWYMSPFDIHIVRNTSELAVLELSAPGKSGAYNGFKLTKRFTLKVDSARVKVDYEIYNNPISVEPLPFAMRMHNTVGVAGRTGHIFWPVERGIWRQEQPGGHYIWEPNPTRGFCGYATDEGQGLALRMEYRLLRKFYYWAEHGTLPRSTLEWYMNELPVPADGTVSTSVIVLPFSNITNPSGVTDELVGKIDTSAVTTANKAGDVTFNLSSTVSGTRQAIVRVRRLPDGEPQTISSQAIELQVGKTTSFALPITVADAGTHEVILDLRNEERPAGELRAAMIVERAHVPYAVQPQEERYAPLAVQMLPKDFNFTSGEIVTPHVPWAKKYAGGKTTFFLLTDGYVQREAVELAQRFEMDPASSFITPGLNWATYALGGYEGRISEQDLIGQLEKEFAKFEKRDVYLLSGPIWKWMTPWMRGALIERVQAGAGLVWITPKETGEEMTPLLPMALTKHGYVNGSLTNDVDHFITRGIPFELIQGIRPYEYKATGETIATIQGENGKTPFIAVGSLGKGRVVTLNMMVKPNTYSGHNITPVREEQPTFHNHEYELALVGRAMIWAAGKESQTQLHAKRNGDVINAVIASEAAGEAVLHVTMRDRFSSKLQVEEHTFSMVVGESTVPIQLPAMPNGMNAVELILKQGATTLDWATVAVESSSEADISSFTSEKPFYTKGDPIKLISRFTGNTKGCSLLITIMDANDRLIARTGSPIVTEQITVTTEIPRPSTLRLYANAYLVDSDENVLAVDRAFVDYRHIMQPDDMMISFGFQGVSQGGTPPYLMKPFYDSLILAGSNGWFHKPGHNKQPELDATRKANLPIQLTSGPLHPGKVVINANSRQMYEKTGDVKHLVRSPLIGEKFDTAIEEKVKRMAETPSIQWGSFDFYNGDESIFQPSDIDLSFDDVTLPLFRDWLKGKYNSLDALNKEWQTNFASWETVMPMTRDQVVQHPTWAPWLDHRLFGDHSLAYAYRHARQKIDQYLPGMRSGASGTTNTENLTGWNWWLMRDSFTSLQPYPGDQTYQQRAFMLNVPQAGWLGYGNMQPDRYNYSTWRWLSFGSFRGINIFSGRNNINPDLTLAPTAKAFVKSLDTSVNGQARAFFLAKPALDPIAFHYSPRSLWTAIPFGFRTQRQASSDGMSVLLEDANFQYDYVAYEQVEQGILSKGKHKLLFLRASTSLSDKEADEIRQFVKDGGVLIADLAPGVLNSNGSPRPAAALDDVFGIKQSRNAIKGKGTVDIDGSAHGITLGKLHLEIECATPFTVTTATALGQWQIEGKQGAAFAVNKFGNGVAICIGTDMLGGYKGARTIRHMERGQQIIGAFAKLRDSLLQAANIKHVVRTTDADGNLLPMRVFRLEGENISFVSVLTDGTKGGPFDATLHLDRAAYVFDLFTGERIAQERIDKLTFSISPPYDARVFTLLNAIPGKLTVNAPDNLKQGDTATITIAVAPVEGAPVDYALRVETTGPTGEPFDLLTKNITAIDGKATLHFDAALNEQPGEYTVQVRNVLTDETVKKVISVTK